MSPMVRTSSSPPPVPVGVAQGGQDEVQLLPVIAAFPQCRAGLDEQYLAVGVLAAVGGGAELVGEQPQGSVVARRRGHPSVLPRGATSDAVGISGAGCGSISTAAGDPGSTAGCGAAW